MTNRSKYRACWLVAGAVLFTSAMLTCTAVSEELPALQDTPIILQATDVLPEEMLSGDGYAIEKDVINDGFINVYTVKTPYGNMEVESTALLKIRINELSAMAHMEELKKTKVFKDALKEGAKAPLETAKGIITSPVETVSGVATGIGRWFSDVGRSIVSDDPHQANVLSTAIGYAAQKRRFAYEYGVDPYTDFEPVQQALAEVSRAGVAGGLTPKLAFSAVKGKGGRVLSVTGTSDTMRKLVMDKSPAELRKINRKKLEAMGVEDSLAENFMENPAFNPQDMTLLVGELDSLSTIKGRDKIIEVAATATHASVARFVRIQVQMLGTFNANVATATEIVRVNRTVFFRTKGGTLVGLFPMDHIAWTYDLWLKQHSAAQAINEIEGVTGASLWVTGTVGDKARKALEMEGWTVIDNVEMTFGRKKNE
jgi:hypothetical protein